MGQCSQRPRCEDCAVRVLRPCFSKLYQRNEWDPIDQDEDIDRSPTAPTPPLGPVICESIELTPPADLHAESAAVPLTVLPAGDPPRRPATDGADRLEGALDGSPPVSPVSGGEVPAYMYEIKETMRRNVRAVHQQLRSMDGWKLASKRAGAEIYVRELRGVSHSKTICRVSACWIVQIIRTAKLSKQSSDHQLLERLSKDMHVYWMGVKVPIIKDRDFVIAEWNHRQPNGKHLTAFVSVSHPQCGQQKRCPAA